MLPGTSLVWSSILSRMKWRYSENIRNMEITRKRVNRGVRSYLLKIGGYVIRHPDFDDKHPTLFKKDGVHLSFIANDKNVSRAPCIWLRKSQPNTRCSRNIFEIPLLFGLSF